jgi:hypothetical protein
VESTFARIFEWLRPGGRVMLSLLTVEADDRVEEWLEVPMFFAGWTPGLGERALHGLGYEIELSKFREDPTSATADPRLTGRSPGSH